MPSSKHHLYYMYSASESESEEEEEDYDPYDDICLLNQKEQDFFNEIAHGPFLNFHYRYPKTSSWNQPNPIRLRYVLHKYVDDDTLNRICPKKDVVKNGLATLDVFGEGKMHLSDAYVKTLFLYAEKWCILHGTNCVDWVVFCIVQFSCI